MPVTKEEVLRALSVVKDPDLGRDLVSLGMIENVSIVNNYRAQFDRVIAKSSVKELLQKMKGQDS